MSSLQTLRIVTLFKIKCDSTHKRMAASKDLIYRYLIGRALGTGWMMYWKHYEDGTELLIVWGLGGVRPGVEKGVVVLLENILFHRATMVHAWISTISIVAEVINNTAIEDMQELLQGAQDLLRQEQAASP